jgi:hypothetical protein
MNELTIGGLAARIAGLERANWRAKKTLFALAALLLATATLAAKAQLGTSKATMFELDDESGHPLAVLGPGNRGPSLMFLDSAGKPMLQVGAAPDNCLQAWPGQIMPLADQQRCAPGLFVFDQNGIPSRISNSDRVGTSSARIRVRKSAAEVASVEELHGDHTMVPLLPQARDRASRSFLKGE